MTYASVLEVYNRCLYGYCGGFWEGREGLMRHAHMS